MTKSWYEKILKQLVNMSSFQREKTEYIASFIRRGKCEEINAG